MQDTSPAQIPKMAYRPDIDGLRAVAVIAVVLFHLGFQSLEGGFLGVDVFFVISGFLITSIIQGQMRVGTFSFKRFYLRRIKRLLPPAFATVATTFIASALILTPDDFIAFSRSAIAAIFSVSNILFFTEAGYWDTLSELKPLLHTWSLGVEEQFYLCWPAMLFLVLRFLGAKRAPLFFALATVIGLGISEWMLGLNPSAAFYLLPARFFEFSLGAVMVYVGRSTIWARLSSDFVRTVLFILSLGALVASFFIYKGSTPFPGINGLWPCLFTGLILLTGSGAASAPAILRLTLSNPVIVWFGKLSYSMYLVHWPVVALLRYKYGLELSPALQLTSMGLILIFTLLLHYGIERRWSARAGIAHTKRSPPPLESFARRIGMAAILMSIVAVQAIAANGWTWRFPALQLTPDQIQAGKGARFTHLPSACNIASYYTSDICDRSRPIKVMTIGNSHEPDGYNFLRGGYSDNPDILFIRFGSTNRCGLFIDDNNRIVAEKSSCADRVKVLMDDKFLDEIDVIVHASNKPMGSNKSGTIDFFKALKSHNSDLKLIVFGGYVNTKTDCAKIINETGSAKNCFAVENVNYFAGDPQDIALFPKFTEVMDHYIDRAALLCRDYDVTTCRAYAGNNVPAFYDTHHNSLEFAEFSGRLYADEFPNLFENLLK